MSSLYLHIPFCEHKCIYCDFYSIAPNEKPDSYNALVVRFLQGLRQEIELRSQDSQFKEPFETIFFGGGTPSLLSPSIVEEILNLLSKKFSLKEGAEITLETNPGTVDLATLRGFRKAGVNRISMGIQSFHDDDLKFLTRIHSAAQAKECVRNAFEAGFDNVSFDLIFALPNQTRARWQSNLHQAMELSPAHISCYSLIVEPNTPLQRMVEAKQVTPLAVEEDAALYELTMEFLGAHGYTQYEVSNFARPGFKSLHNSNYWNHKNYLGFGPSAHSFWNGKRWWNVSSIVNYLDRVEANAVPVAGEETLTQKQLMEEAIFLGLRSEGVDVAGFRRKFEKDLLTDYGPTIDALVDSGLALFEDNRLRLTSKGYSLCDEICCSFR
ncbi:MAG: radical SAM family heme chaperone HemW [Bacteroidota bacterium]